MIKHYFISLLLLSLNMESQNWDSITGGHFQKFIERVLYDSVHNELIVSSKFVKEVGNKYVRGICRWNGSRWDSLAGGINTGDTANVYPNGMALGCIPYQGKLLVGGMFNSVGGINTRCLALWDGNKWDSLPKRAFSHGGYPPQVNGFLKHNGLLYITGSFDTIAGQKATGLATWDGITFNPIILPTDSAFQAAGGLVKYNNDLYIISVGFKKGSPIYRRNIYKFNGANWVSIISEKGILGAIAGFYGLIIYQNELYAYGHFTQLDGNPGNNIMKWNGSIWKDTGFGNEFNYSNISSMLVYKNKLWAFGSFDEVQGKVTSKAAVYDGYSWCGLKDSLDNNILTATVFNDTIYAAGGFWSCNGDSSINRLVKLKNPNLYRNCAFADHSIKYENINVYPNPFTNSITVQIPNAYSINNTLITITNSLGQILQSQIATSNNVLLSTSSLSSGLYYLTIQDSSHQKTVKIVKE